MTIMVDATRHRNPLVPKVRKVMDCLAKMRRKVGPSFIWAVALLVFCLLALIMRLLLYLGFYS